VLTTERNAILEAEFDKLEEWAAEIKAEEERKAVRIKDMIDNFSLEKLGLTDDNILDGDMNAVPLSSFEGKIVGLYFSASWCGPCRHFTPKLAEKYQSLVDAGELFDIILICGDSSEDNARDYFASMPWKMLRFEDQEVNELANEVFEVEGIPTLVLVNCESGNIITSDGRNALFSGTLCEIEEREDEKKRLRKVKADQIEFQMPDRFEDPRGTSTFLSKRHVSSLIATYVARKATIGSFTVSSAAGRFMPTASSVDKTGMQRCSTLKTFLRSVMMFDTATAGAHLLRSSLKDLLNAIYVMREGTLAATIAMSCSWEIHPDCKMDESDLKMLEEEAAKLPDEILDIRALSCLAKVFRTCLLLRHLSSTWPWPLLQLRRVQLLCPFALCQRQGVIRCGNFDCQCGPVNRRASRRKPRARR
jgi:thiol-disulfide isomerase/thioredoxin